MIKGKRKSLRIAIIILITIVCVVSIAFLMLSIQSATLDQKIAQFEAQRKIPDSENAAVIYERLSTDVNFTSIFEDDIFKQMSTKEFYKVYRKPWKSEDYPEAAEWIKNQQDFINELLKASKFKKCYFPLPTNQNEWLLHLDKFRTFRDIAQLMVYAANNDIAEGRINDAIEKYQFTIKMAEHIYQQPLIIDYMTGNVIESITIGYLEKIILETEISEEQLKVIESIPFQVEDTWQEITQQILEGERLFADKMYGKHVVFFYYISAIFRGQHTLKDSIKSTYNSQFLRLLSYRRANRICISLRRFKNQNGQWPESLDQIKSIVDPNVLIDPQNNGSFVYKLTKDGFSLYSKGPNNIDERTSEYDIFLSDEHGQLSSDETDDFIIWTTGR